MYRVYSPERYQALCVAHRRAWRVVDRCPVPFGAGQHLAALRRAVALSDAACRRVRLMGLVFREVA